MQIYIRQSILLGLLLAIPAAASHAQQATLTTLYDLSAPRDLGQKNDDGLTPQALVPDAGGVFYTSCADGGPHRTGTIIELAADGTLLHLHAFSHLPYPSHITPDGAEPSSLIRGTNGYLYGTSISGGTSGSGTVFESGPGGKLITLHTFSYINNQAKNAGGSDPLAGLVEGSGGSYYGTTSQGGANGAGTIFKISATGDFKVIYNFVAPDGQFCEAPLVQGRDGYFYGTEHFGGAYHDGAVFKIKADGTFTKLHDFTSSQSGGDGGADGLFPSGLVKGSDGNFYGTTSRAGANNYGTIFRITPAGVLTTIYNFTSADGYSSTGLLRTTAGELYGTTSFNSKKSSGGEVFKVATDDRFSVVYKFQPLDSQGDNFGGLGCVAPLIQIDDNTLAGTTVQGGANGTGTIFKLSLAD